MFEHIDIQLFGDEEIEIDDVMDDGSIEVDLDEFVEDEPDEPEEEAKPEDKPKDKPNDKKEEIPEDVVPKKALLAERKKYQRKLQALKEQLQQKPSEDDTKKSLDELGLDENIANTLASLISKSKSKAENVEALVNKKFRDLEFENLKNDSFYSDAEDFREELEEMADKTGMTVKQCYNAMFGESKYKLSETALRSKIEQEVLANVKKRQEYGSIDTTENGETEVKSNKIKLTKDEMDIAKAAGMTAAEYAAMKNAKDISHMERLYKKKKG